ncbi:putative transcriptional regulator [Mycolicibacterium phlei]|uniref:helix-turn-helix transcriptional regulator n=1 Tax=Mycobacteroides chelonae TaxID=1774 RepID=UPI000619901E|nr:helix-turn-helix transcriptional regulator [Mycobacteroides chelonae]ANA96354.1 XRE family transcriptional regulator [Mycobacteroides chelonae CCUG 47445]ORV17527.1 XRE family transcriptional regulator [Mycobacteroides chelonae]VEG14190.1 putative transcriptional regulator [Mycolicibacterium phlei]
MGETENKGELASVLRAWRERIRPADVGLPAGTARRTPGLRREELAMLAGVSVDYLVRLEQGRAPRPSPQVLQSLASVLRLSDEERDHMFQVSGAALPRRDTLPRNITPSVQRILDRLADTPLAVFTAAHDILVWNDMWAVLNGDPDQLTGLNRNIVWQHFISGQPGLEFDAQHAVEFPDDLVADIRVAVGRYPGDTALAHMVTRLRAESPEFESRWASAHIAQHKSSRKTVQSPVGPITVDCDVLTMPGSDLKIVVYTVAPGTPDAEKLDLLRITGGRTFAASSSSG